jgi:hypothetical protein
MSLQMKIVINVDDVLAEKLLNEYGVNASIYAQHGYSGTMVCCESVEDFDKLDSDQDYLEQRLIETTTNF